MKILSPVEAVRRQLGLRTHRLRALPVVVLMPHSRCNCRCVMCDIWKANQDRRELSADDLSRHRPSLSRLGVQTVVLSGGEPLMHSNLWRLCALLEELGIGITLLSTGLLLRRYAKEIVRWCDEVIVSLDGSPAVHDRIRNVPRAFARLADGVLALRELQPSYRVVARCVVQRANYQDLPQVIETAREIGLSQVSFLAADISSEAFNRPAPWEEDRVAEVALTSDEASELTNLIERILVTFEADFDSRFIAERPEKMLAIAQYFQALNGDGEFPLNRCNAPWVSTVVEADGTVRPCFFHRPLGNISEHPLEEILNSRPAVEFRRDLNIATDPICRKCVCTLSLAPWSTPSAT